jgi:hypothetical protein
MKHPSPPADNRTVINLSDVLLEDPAYSALGKGLDYAVASSVLPIENFLNGVEKAVGFLAEEDVEEVRHETIRILEASRKSKDNMSGAESRPVRALRTNVDLTVFPPDKGNATVVLNTREYKQILRPF